VTAAIFSRPPTAFCGRSTVHARLFPREVHGPSGLRFSVGLEYSIALPSLSSLLAPARPQLIGRKIDHEPQPSTTVRSRARSDGTRQVRPASRAATSVSGQRPPRRAVLHRAGGDSELVRRGALKFRLGALWRVPEQPGHAAGLFPNHEGIPQRGRRGWVSRRLRDPHRASRAPFRERAQSKPQNTTGDSLLGSGSRSDRES
jgi:hypothetical protein